MERIFSQAEVNKLFSHLSYRTLHHWNTIGLLRASREEVDGRGRVRFYSLEDVYLIALVEELTASNLPLETIKIVVEKLIKEHDGIKGDLDDCLIIYKTDPGIRGWQAGPIVGRFNREEMVELINPNSLMGPIWNYPSVVVVSLAVIAKRVRELAREADIKL